MELIATFILWPMFIPVFWVLPIIALISYKLVKHLGLSIYITIPVSAVLYVVFLWGNEEDWLVPGPLFSSILGVSGAILATGFLWVGRAIVRKIRKMMHSENGQAQSNNPNKDIPPQ